VLLSFSTSYMDQGALAQRALDAVAGLPVRALLTAGPALDASRLNEARAVGTNKLPATLGGLLVHIADHTQRHVGQAVTTAKFIRALRGAV